MAFTKRGLRLVEALGKHSKDNTYYDARNIFNKIKFTAANEDGLKGTFTVDSSMCSGFQIMHGGFTSLVVDVMCAYAHVAKTNGRVPLTTNICINYTSPATIGDKIIVEAKTLKNGSHPVMESILYKEDGKLIAKGTTSLVITREASQKIRRDFLEFDVLKDYDN